MSLDSAGGRPTKKKVHFAALPSAKRINCEVTGAAIAFEKPTEKNYGNVLAFANFNTCRMGAPRNTDSRREGTIRFTLIAHLTD